MIETTLHNGLLDVERDAMHPIDERARLLAESRARRLPDVTARYEAGLRARFLMAVHGRPGGLTEGTCLRPRASGRSEERQGGLGRAW